MGKQKAETFSAAISTGFHLPGVLLHAVSYLMLRLLAETYASYPDSSFWYPPAVINFCLLLVGGRRYLVFPLALRVLGTVLLHPESLLEAFPYLLLYSALEAFLALGLRRLTAPIPNLKNPAHLSLFLGVAFLLPLVSVFFSGGAYPPAFVNPAEMAIGHALEAAMVTTVSMVLIVPLILHVVLPYLDLWADPPREFHWPTHWPRIRLFVLQTGLLALALAAVLIPGLWPGSTPYYLFFPPLAWIVRVKGMRGAAGGLWFIGATLSMSLEVLGFNIPVDPMLNMAVLLIATSTLYFAAFLEQKRAAQDRASAKDTRMKGVLDAAFDGILVVQGGLVLESNDTMETLLRAPVGGLVGKSVHTLFRADSARSLLQLLEAPPAGVVELDLYLPAGEQRSLELCARPVQEGGQRLLVVAVRDVTQRQAAQAALKESEEKYCRVFEMMGSAFAHFSRLDPAGHQLDHFRLTDHNRAFLELFDTRGPVAGQTDPRQWQAEGIPGGFPWMGVLARAADSFRPFQLEHHLPERRAWYSVTAFSLGRDSVSLVFHDISAIRSSEAAMLERQNQLESLLANMPGMAYRRINDDQGTMKFLTRGCLHLTGWQPEDLVDNRVLSYQDLVLPEDRPKVRAAVKEALAKGQAFTLNYRIRDVSGREKWVWEQGALLVSPDGKGHLEGLIVDVSQRMAAERQRNLLELRMNETQKLESLGVMAGGIAHDFNNLLVSILANVDLLRLGAQGEEDRGRRLQQVETAARRAADLTNQMLAYAGRGAATKAAVRLPELVDEMSDLMQSVISKRAQLRTSHRSGQAHVDADPSQLRQVVMNLLTNASDALGNKDGLIQLETGQATLSSAQVEALRFSPGAVGGEYVYVEVRDEGCGMTEEQMGRIFEPFYTTKFAGRGLGLAAVRGVVTASRGGLELESRPLGGTRMRVYFPASQSLPEPLAEKPAALEPVNGAGRVVLVVDDEEGVRRAATEILEYFGFKVTSARDGIEAVELFKGLEGTVALVLLDLTMPRMGGVETLESLRKLNPGLPAIISSGYGNETEAFTRDGRLVALPKPYNTLDLMSAVAEALSRSGQTDPPPS